MTILMSLSSGIASDWDESDDSYGAMRDNTSTVDDETPNAQDTADITQQTTHAFKGVSRNYDDYIEHLDAHHESDYIYERLSNSEAARRPAIRLSMTDFSRNRAGHHNSWFSDRCLEVLMAELHREVPQWSRITRPACPHG